MAWGGRGKITEDGVHWVIWKTGGDGDKGERLSWDMKESGEIHNAHYTDQNNSAHSADPNDWRGMGEDGGCFNGFVWLLVLGIGSILTAIAGVVLC